MALRSEYYDSTEKDDLIQGTVKLLCILYIAVAVWIEGAGV